MIPLGFLQTCIVVNNIFNEYCFQAIHNDSTRVEINL
nr:MAG TPA_asm: hypothetical protein [Caudoviricetes sp.]